MNGIRNTATLLRADDAGDDLRGEFSDGDDGKPTGTYPQVARNYACPPEDCGGPWGY